MHTQRQRNKMLQCIFVPVTFLAMLPDPTPLGRGIRINDNGTCHLHLTDWRTQLIRQNRFVFRVRT